MRVAKLRGLSELFYVFFLLIILSGILLLGFYFLGKGRNIAGEMEFLKVEKNIKGACSLLGIDFEKPENEIPEMIDVKDAKFIAETLGVTPCLKENITFFVVSKLPQGTEDCQGNCAVVGDRLYVSTLRQEVNRLVTTCLLIKRAYKFCKENANCGAEDAMTCALRGLASQCYCGNSYVWEVNPQSVGLRCGTRQVICGG